jgi:hypothetical protein
VKYHDDSKCGSCGGPLECERDAICCTCCPTPPVVVIELWPIVENCCICGEPSYKSGIPMYEDLVLPNDWQGEWGGKPACELCRRLQGELTEPVRDDEFLRMRTFACAGR